MKHIKSTPTQDVGVRVDAQGKVWDAVERVPTQRWRLWIAFLKTERSLMFAYVRLKSLMFAFFEKKYFFPALWPSGAWNQYGEQEMEYGNFGVLGAKGAGIGPCGGRVPPSLKSYGGHGREKAASFRAGTIGEVGLSGFK